MASFFEKLKKGMGIEEKEQLAENPAEKKPKKIKKDEPTIKKLKLTIEEEPVQKEEKPSQIPERVATEKKDWLKEPAGQLQIDVYQTANDLVIQSAIAGIKSENLEITMEKDVLSIKGEREKPALEQGDYFTKECYWGPFQREVILPTEVDPDRAEAALKVGVLTIRFPKLQREKKRKIILKI
ncbi:MAG: Hsp20/alpha crystallin family protein [bacterium]